ncbi:hypothetical protein GGF32_001124 [Allomyces javanicus]|nr:hypothetical protein GGF32_001124 [Allomyces javanicus]
MAGTLSELHVRQPIAIPPSVLEEIRLDVEFPQRFRQLERLTIDTSSFGQLALGGAPCVGVPSRLAQIDLLESNDPPVPLLHDASWLDMFPYLVSLEIAIPATAEATVFRPTDVQRLATLHHLQRLVLDVDMRMQEGQAMPVGPYHDGGALHGIHFPSLTNVCSTESFFTVLFECILPNVTDATVKLVAAPPGVLYLPTMPRLDWLTIRGPHGDDMPITDDWWTIADNLASVAPRMRTLFCDIPVKWGRALVHPTLKHLSMDVIAWNNLEGRVVVPSLTDLMLSMYTLPAEIRHLLLDPPMLHLTSVRLPDRAMLTLEAAAHLTILPNITRLKANNLLMGGPSALLLSMTSSSRVVWPVIVSAASRRPWGVSLVVVIAKLDFDVTLIEYLVQQTTPRGLERVQLHVDRSLVDIEATTQGLVERFPIIDVTYLE